MRNDKRKKTKLMNNTINSKTKLIQALTPLCSDITWMSDLIQILKNTDLPEDNFELSGLIRKICYELILENPELFMNNNPKTIALKIILYNALAKIKVKRSNEIFSKMVQRVATELKEQSLRKKLAAGRNR